MGRELGIIVTRTPVLADPWVYAVVRSETDDSVWRRTTSALEAWDVTHVATYDLPLTARGGDWWRGALPTALPVGTYKAVYYVRASSGAAAADDDVAIGESNAFAWSGASIGVPVPSGGWRYSDRAHVVALVGNDAVNVVWSLDGDNLEDVGLMEQDGIQADTYIDRALMLEGLTVPINTGTASAVVVQSLADIGAHLTVWWGFHHRGLEELANRGVASSSDIAGLMKGYKDYADEELEKLATILAIADADDEPPVPAVQAIVPVREQWCGGPWGYG